MNRIVCLYMGVVSFFVGCSQKQDDIVEQREQLGRGMLQVSDMGKRNKKGILVIGFSNILSGATGVMGAIDYSSSVGIISSTRAASRFPLIPTAGLLMSHLWQWLYKFMHSFRSCSFTSFKSVLHSNGKVLAIATRSISHHLTRYSHQWRRWGRLLRFLCST